VRRTQQFWLFVCLASFFFSFFFLFLCVLSNSRGRGQREREEGREERGERVGSIFNYYSEVRKES